MHRNMKENSISQARQGWNVHQDELRNFKTYAILQGN